MQTIKDLFLYSLVQFTVKRQGRAKTSMSGQTQTDEIQMGHGIIHNPKIRPKHGEHKAHWEDATNGRQRLNRQVGLYTDAGDTMRQKVKYVGTDGEITEARETFPK